MTVEACEKGCNLLGELTELQAHLKDLQQNPEVEVLISASHPLRPEFIHAEEVLYPYISRLKARIAQLKHEFQSI